MSQVSQILTEAIVSEDLTETSYEYIENIIDSKIGDETVKQIPLLKSLVAFKNIYDSIQDEIFLKKAFKVLFELENVSEEQRLSFLDDLVDEQHDAGEKLMLYLDSLQDFNKCIVFGRVCRKRAWGDLSKEEFLFLSDLIQRATLSKLKLIKHYESRDELKSTEYDFYHLINLGLVVKVAHQEQLQFNESPGEYDKNIKGGDISFGYMTTPEGDILLREIDYMLEDLQISDYLI